MIGSSPILVLVAKVRMFDILTGDVNPFPLRSTRYFGLDESSATLIMGQSGSLKIPVRNLDRIILFPGVQKSCVDWTRYVVTIRGMRGFGSP